MKRFFSILICFCVVISAVGCQAQRRIVHKLDERDANDIIVFLDNKGVKASKVQAVAASGGAQGEVFWDIAVDPMDATQAMAYLNAAGLPRKASRDLLKIFAQQGLVPSELEQKIRYQAGLAAQIASTIRKIDGVLDADVQLSFPEQDPLNPNAPKEGVTASVYVKHTGVLDNPNTQLVPKIRRLVASSIQNLKFEDVTVIQDRARFSDLSLRATLSKAREDREYVTVWTMVVAKDSLGRFRTIFFGFIVLGLLLLITLMWTVWKIHLLIPGGGLKEFFALHPYYPGGIPPEPEKKLEEGEEEFLEEEISETEEVPEEEEEPGEVT